VIDLEIPAIAMHALRARERRTAAAALFTAAAMSLIRAFLLPWLIRIAPPNTFPGMDPQKLLIMSVCSMLLFGLLAMWALKEPFAPSAIALLFYIAISIPDLVNQQGFLAKGIISKMVMMTILLRALAAGLVHATMGETKSRDRYGNSFR
jgi:hypothetical protein